ncbi:MAG: HIT family protein [Armatimonadetes bacterium]|nr:HIT family protein [Armatimonadota bacterium]
MRSSEPTSGDSERECLFCRIIRGEVPHELVLGTERTVAFLDHRPLFHGHCLVVPRVHYVTLLELPPAELAPLFQATQLVAQAVREAMEADGIFVGVNNVVSQSVPHLHIHVVPRRRGDGLKGFFWPRQRYESAEAMAEVADRVRAAVDHLGGSC